MQLQPHELFVEALRMFQVRFFTIGELIAFFIDFLIRHGFIETFGSKNAEPEFWIRKQPKKFIHSSHLFCSAYKRQSFNHIGRNTYLVYFKIA